MIAADTLAALVASPFVGSFLGLVAQRLPAGRPIVLARSACDHCARTLTPRDLVPLLSWLARRGRCGCGKVLLGAFYPAIELAALAVAISAASVHAGWLLLASLALGWTLLTLAAIDLRTQLLPDVLTLPLIPAGLLVAWLRDAPLPGHVLGALAGYLAFVAIAWLYHRLRQREGLGLGDAKLLAGAGAWLGWQALPDVVALAAGGAVLVALVSGLCKRELATTTPVAFGPYLALAFWLIWLLGPLVGG
jgi:leader peptidase (prepilin peptidase)/N-methyltransferase